MGQTSNFLAFDLGASGGRALLGRWDGRRFAVEELHRFANGPVSVPGSGLHWDALQLWSELQAGITRYAAAHAAPLRGIGVDTWGVDYALLDGAGRLLGSPHCYRDPRSSGMLEEVTRRVPRERIFALTGIQFMQLNTLYQLYGAAQAGDPQLAQAARLLLMPDLFHYWLAGAAACEYTNATTTQLLHCAERRWATELLDELGLRADLLPDLVPPGTQLGALRREVVDATGLREAPMVIAPATHDTASAVAAVPGLDARSAYISSGTWSLMGVETTEPALGERALALNVTNEGGVGGTFRLLKNITGLWLVQECRRRWQRDGQQVGWEALLALAEQAPPLRSLVDPDAPDFLSPTDMPAAIRAFCRRTGQPEPESPGAIVRCCLESVALRYRAVLAMLESLTGRRIEVIRVVGGGCHNRLLNQLTADACGRPVLAGPAEATALGNLAVQAIAAGELPDLAAARRAIGESAEIVAYEPRPGNAWEGVAPL